MKKLLGAKTLLAMATPLLLGPLLLILLLPRIPAGADISLPLLLWLLLMPLAGGGMAGWQQPRRATIAGLKAGLLLSLFALILLASLLPGLLLTALTLQLAGGSLLLSLCAAYSGAGLRQAGQIIARERRERE